MTDYSKKDYNDLIIIPSSFTNIRSRKEIFPYYKHNDNFHLPLITAPMDTVVDEKNDMLFLENHINVCYPRGIKHNSFHNGSMQFESISLGEFEELVLQENIISNSIDGKYYVCIDIANGHMNFLHNLIKSAKNKFGDKIVIMAGNIANPDTYRIMCNIGCDFVRCGIGNGNACTTTKNVAIGYPMASLIKECYFISLTFTNPSKIIADGGIKSYSDIMKALALGADYVQIGSMFNKALESCGDTYFGYFKINQYGHVANWLFKNGYTLKKKFRGMSTKEVQKKWGKDKLTTSEGVTRVRSVEYRLNTWTENFTDYLKSNMSYCNSKTLKEYIGNNQLIEISNQSYLRFDK